MYKNVLEYLEASALKFPDKTAIQDETSSMIYSELLQNAKRIGSYLRKYHSVNKPIVVSIDRTLESVVMFMGVLYSGNFYVPLDRNLPDRRIETILQTLDTSIVLCVFEETEKLQSKISVQPEVYEEMIKSEVDEGFLNDVRRAAVSTDPLYCIFTSGSTGIPKGVVNTHMGVINLVESFEKEFHFCSDDIFGNQAPFDFDVSTKDIYNTFKYGGTMQIIPKQLFSYPVKLIEFVNERKITVAFWAVSVLCIVAALKGMKRVQPLKLGKILFSGEVLPVKVLNYWMDNLPDTMFVNLYGPTEITCNCTFYKIEKRLDLTQALPIGKAFDNMSVFLLQEDGRVCKKGEEGEICVGGAGVALGYYNNPEKTNEVFVQNPVNKMYDERIYRTGDIGYQNKEGDLVFVCRKDFQIKHMGHRIELQEIEIAVNALEYIHSCCCLYNRSAEKIVLFYSAGSECDQKIIEDLRNVLPGYMVPNKLVFKEGLPLNSHGKIDRKLLELEV